MNYQKLYDKIINIAKLRNNVGYVEKHHIIPRCLGGLDTAENIVELTAREHFVAHQLLVKIHPTNHKLVFAANMMTVSSSTHNTQRSHNRTYEWLKKRYNIAAKINSTGKNNSNYGKVWIHNPDIKENKKVLKSEYELIKDDGWILGRKINWEPKRKRNCSQCHKDFILKNNERLCSIECKILYTNPKYVGKEPQFLKLYDEMKNMDKVLKTLGFAGAVGSYYNWAKSVLYNRHLYE